MRKLNRQEVPTAWTASQWQPVQVQRVLTVAEAKA
jgi:hypothetical protein